MELRFPIRKQHIVFLHSHLNVHNAGVYASRTMQVYLQILQDMTAYNESHPYIYFT